MPRGNFWFRVRRARWLLVADAGCLERSLILALQVLEVQKNAILCLNLMDEAAKKGIEIDVAALERELGIPGDTVRRTAGKGSARARSRDTPSGGQAKMKRTRPPSAIRRWTRI